MTQNITLNALSYCDENNIDATAENNIYAPVENIIYAPVESISILTATAAEDISILIAAAAENISTLTATPGENISVYRSFTCVICDEDNIGYGNNPHVQLKLSGTCCDSCNDRVIDIVAARCEALREQNKYMKEDVDDSTWFDKICQLLNGEYDKQDDEDDEDDEDDDDGENNMDTADKNTTVLTTTQDDLPSCVSPRFAFSQPLNNRIGYSWVADNHNKYCGWTNYATLRINLECFHDNTADDVGVEEMIEAEKCEKDSD